MAPGPFDDWPASTINHLRSYTFCWENTNNIKILLKTSCFLLVPGIGWVIFLGYASQTIGGFAFQGNTNLPAFTLTNTGRYLFRGILPFLIFLLCSALLSIAFVFEKTLLLSVPIDDLAAFPQLPIIIGTMILSAFLIPTFLLPVIIWNALSTLRIALSDGRPDLAALSFARTFLHLVGWELLQAEIFLFATAPLATLLGVMALGIGIFPALATITFAQHHLLHQLYTLYVTRGGTDVLLTADIL